MINEIQAHKYCRDDISKIENYDKAANDHTQTWQLHHRLELTLDGEFALSRHQLILHDMYYNRPYYELIFLTKAEHNRIHHTGKIMSADAKRKISAFQRNRIKSSEERRRISESNKGKHLSEDTKRKMSESAKRRWAKKKSNDSVRN